MALDHGGRDGLALDFLELGLAVEELELAGRSRHEQIDHPLGLDGEAHEARLARIREGFLGEEGGEGNLAHANPAILKKVTSACDGGGEERSWLGDGFV